MIRRIHRYLVGKEQALRSSFGHDITDPAERKRSQFHFNWLDHGVLRLRWHNFEEFAPGAYRSNHPNHKRFTAYAALGVKSVLNLRGVAKQPHYLFEVESCEKLGLTLVNSQMAARRAPSVKELTKLIHSFETIEKPFLMHCKSGADRTGLAAAIYLMLYAGKPLEEARGQLSFRFLHIRKTATGILDHFLDVYAARNARAPIAIDDWIKSEYDPEALTKSFAEKQASLRFWQGWR
ncbi:Dual specificity phosphatase, catalytic domain [Yoonia tamlensis]|uniref:Dual specificity phosphatase, catalytic domain n=1 Tax=Yoonia tamlensis TaxID=390270 RepID=A0A1I6FVR7_9RHOB|nr:tyrosine-protein phosphatase [Yoonia tamlensis]SFR34052.1 Dual specificity phosphatase, catalytic domain [Yoonia tamlensis]